MNNNYTMRKFSAVIALILITGCNKSPEPDATALSGLTVNTAVNNVVDNDVTTNVKMALMEDPTIKAFDIDVITLKGDVRLIGTVDSQSQVDTAVKLAQDAGGTHIIHDELIIKS